MLDKTVAEDRLFLPHCNNRYLVSRTGTVIDLSSSMNLDGDTLAIETAAKMQLVIPRKTLVTLAFKNCNLPPSKWLNLSVINLDDDRSNCSADNLIWGNSESIEVYRNNVGDVFHWIPGFSNYGINPKGEILHLKKSVLLKATTDSLGYKMCRLLSDIGEWIYLGVHRLLAMTYIPYDARVLKNDVNHLDGVKWNNDVANLEWASRSRNLLHAYENGMRSQNIGVTVKDLRSGIVSDYFSIEECARQLGFDGETMRLRASSCGGKVFPPGVLVKFTSDETAWVEIDDLTEALKRNGLPRKVTVLLKATGETTSFNSIGKAAKFLGLQSATLRWRLSNAMESYEDLNVAVKKQ